MHLLRELKRVTKQSGFLVLVFPNKKHVLVSWWEWLIARFSDFASYGLPEQDCSESLVAEMAELELDVVLLDWIDSYDTISHFPNWPPLRIGAFAATLLLPRPPRVVGKRFGTRVMLIVRKR